LVVTWAITALPVLAPLRDQLLGLADFALPVLAAVISAAWYAFWRWAQPRFPDWLIRAVLGSAKTPVYLGKHAATPAADVDPGIYYKPATTGEAAIDQGTITTTTSGKPIVGPLG
jgi:hypothetical protein